MRDFNFFSSFIEAKKNSVYKYIIWGFISACIVVIVVSLAYNNIMKTKGLEEKVTNLKDYINSSEVVDQINMVEEMKRKISIMEEYLSVIDNINDNLEEVYLVDSELLQKVEDSFPKDLFLQNISLNISDVKMTGISKDRILIAEFQHNLKKLDVFDNVHVVMITKDAQAQGSYIFNMICTFKDVKYNEDNQ